jgi:gliding motility-associated protein GldC
MSQSEIIVRIQLDQNRIPEKIEWKATEAGQAAFNESKSVFIALLDKETLDTSTLFLWTKECQVGEMDRKVYYSLASITDGYYRASQNTELANEMRKFVQYFGEKTGIIQPEK